MKSMKPFGTALVGYEGVAKFTVKENDTEIVNKGCFEAAQFHSGRMAISIMLTDLPKPTEITFDTSADDNISFKGIDVDGWTITLSGETSFTRLSWLFAPFAREPTEVNLVAQYTEAKRDGAKEDGYSGMQFSISNLLWHNSSKEKPEIIELRVNDFKVTVAPVEGYLEIAQRLPSTHGVEPTALVGIEAPPTRRLPPQAFREFMEDLVYVFRLVTGNLVDWYYGEAVDDRTKEPVERIHNYAMTGPYSKTIRYRPLKKGYRSSIPKLDIAKLVDAFLNDSASRIDRETLKPLINQFTNACDESSYLESRGLMASTLVELIASKNAHTYGKSEVISQSDFKANILPVLERAIGSTAYSKCVRKLLKNNLQGAFRSSFPRKLRLLNETYKMCLSNKEIRRIVTTRNDLVHRGTYGAGRWDEDYQFLIWTNFIALCRLTGYEDKLPSLQNGRRLEV
ncbi:MAG: hypothetical protein F4Y50_04390 [Dehalococcoidia bacterium]|nr:hypothetical protein [Dehalococcoidia bacterium]